MSSPWRPGGEKHDVAHRAWQMPAQKGVCDKCLRQVSHPIHWRQFRDNKDWFGWKNVKVKE